jgi:hypothetical protein
MVGFYRFKIRIESNHASEILAKFSFKLSISFLILHKGKYNLRNIQYFLKNKLVHCRNLFFKYLTLIPTLIFIIYNSSLTYYAHYYIFYNS